MERVGLCALMLLAMPCELVNSVTIRPQPPWRRMSWRKTVSVTPAMGASIVAGRTSTPPMRMHGGNWGILGSFTILAKPGGLKRNSGAAR